MSLHQEVTNQLISQLEKGTIPWRKDWSTSSGLPSNHITKNTYSGINIPILWCSAAINLHDCIQWATYKQLKDAGIQVNKGSKATTCVFFKQLTNTDDQGEETHYRMAKSFKVFNLDQTDYVQEKEVNTPFVQVIDKAMDMPNALNVFYATGEPAYSPTLDRVYMPNVTSFFTYDAYFSTLAHECSHATGHKNRLDRNLTGRFGDDSYAMEELIAELSAAFICAENRIKYNNQHASYLAHWLKVLRMDSKALFTVAAKAQLASKYINDSIKLYEKESELGKLMA